MVTVIKANGEKEPFSEQKLRASIHRAGIPQEIEDSVAHHIEKKLYDGIHTKEIYQSILDFLGTSAPSHHRARYSLKQAIMDLGPTGFPFEKFVARILDREGYHTTTNVIATGTCVRHEVDVVAKKNTEVLMVEAKFHNGSGIKTDVQVSMYTKARFDDTKGKNNFTDSLLVTNTKATLDAITFAECVGMHVMTWSYPENESVRDKIEKYHLHPITTLVSLPNSYKQQLLEQNIVLCSELVEKGIGILSTLPEKTQQEIIREAKAVSSLV